jgi:hypothetical protein
MATHRLSILSSTPLPPLPNLVRCAACWRRRRSRLAGQRDRSLLYHPSSYEEVIWQADQSLLRVTIGDDTWALTRSCVTTGGRLQMTCARASQHGAAPLMVAHVDVDREGGTVLLLRSSTFSFPHPTGALIVAGIEINTGGGAEVAAPTDAQQQQAAGLGKVRLPLVLSHAPIAS